MEREHINYTSKSTTERKWFAFRCDAFCFSRTRSCEWHACWRCWPRSASSEWKWENYAIFVCVACASVPVCHRCRLPLMYSVHFLLLLLDLGNTTMPLDVQLHKMRRISLFWHATFALRPSFDTKRTMKRKKEGRNRRKKMWNEYSILDIVLCRLCIRQHARRQLHALHDFVSAQQHTVSRHTNRVRKSTAVARCRFSRF